jgi:hypothetical protein
MWSVSIFHAGITRAANGLVGTAPLGGMLLNLASTASIGIGAALVCVIVTPLLPAGLERGLASVSIGQVGNEPRSALFPRRLAAQSESAGLGHRMRLCRPIHVARVGIAGEEQVAARQGDDEARPHARLRSTNHRLLQW